MLVATRHRRFTGIAAVVAAALTVAACESTGADRAMPVVVSAQSDGFSIRVPMCESSDRVLLVDLFTAKAELSLRGTNGNRERTSVLLSVDSTTLASGDLNTNELTVVGRKGSISSIAELTDILIHTRHGYVEWNPRKTGLDSDKPLLVTGRGVTTVVGQDSDAATTQRSWCGK